MTGHQISKESKERAELIGEYQHPTCSCGAAAWLDVSYWVCTRSQQPLEHAFPMARRTS